MTRGDEGGIRRKKKGEVKKEKMKLRKSKEIIDNRRVRKKTIIEYGKECVLKNSAQYSGPDVPDS